MVSVAAVFANSSFTIISISGTTRFKNKTFLSKSPKALSYVINGSTTTITTTKPRVVVDSLKLLEWDKLCDSVASFAATSLGKQAIKEQLWYLDQTFEESLNLLEETNAAVQMHTYGAMMDFTGIDITLVKSAIQNARRSFPVSGNEAVALAVLLEFIEGLQFNVKAAIKEDADCQKYFTPLVEIIMELVVNRLVVKSIRLLIDDDGIVKDSASGALKHARDQVRFLERKLDQLMESLIRKEMDDSPSMAVSNIDGRWCIRSGTNNQMSFQGLLLSSGSDSGSIVEPLVAIPLNDELQRAKASVIKAESDVLLKITNMMKNDLHEIEHLFNSIIRLDVINARARYSISYKGACPDLFLPYDKDSISIESHPTQRKWSLYMPKAYHPLLLQQHRQNLRKATKELNDAISDMKRRKQQGGILSVKEETNIHISSLEKQVAQVKKSPPIPVDIFVEKNTRVLVITGPNTGGKTIFLKTIGLASMMAKSGLYVISSEPVKIPWFDSVFADIGDEQSLSQSLSTFSGHLKQISEIRSHSTSLSLVLLDEVGAGTNPLEGAALGMALLESFAEGGTFLTMATTHHGELKTLKYSNDAFENACMEFDEVNLKPTYKILWGVPGRSNAINIAERLGMPEEILENARNKYGAASAEINEIIVDMERFKQNFHEYIRDGQHHMMLAKDLHQKLLNTKEKLTEHAISQRYKKTQEISDTAGLARSVIHKKLREHRAKISTNHNAISNHRLSRVGTSKTSSPIQTTNTVKNNEQLVTAGSRIKESSLELPKVGDMVYVSSLNKKAMVLKVDPSKEQIIVQSGMIKLKLRLADVIRKGK